MGNKKVSPNIKIDIRNQISTYRNYKPKKYEKNIKPSIKPGFFSYNKSLNEKEINELKELKKKYLNLNENYIQIQNSFNDLMKVNDSLQDTQKKFNEIVKENQNLELLKEKYDSCLKEIEQYKQIKIKYELLIEEDNKLKENFKNYAKENNKEVFEMLKKKMKNIPMSQKIIKIKKKILVVIVIFIVIIVEIMNIILLKKKIKKEKINH